MESEDPTVVRVIAVSKTDVVTALEANERRDVGAVLRITPPFSGRMRARLHREGAEGEYDDPEPMHVPPGRFVEDVPPFPTPDETADELRSDPTAEYTPQTHRQRHERRVERWRSAVRGSFLDRITLETPDGTLEVELAVLG